MIKIQKCYKINTYIIQACAKLVKSKERIITMAEKIDISDLKQVSFSDKSVTLFTQALADPASKLGLGSAAALSAAQAAALALGAVRCCPSDELSKTDADLEKLMTYFIHLIDEENKAKLPLEKRLGKDNVPEEEIEAGYRTACIIVDEILYSSLALIDVLDAASDKLCGCVAAQCAASVYFAKNAMEGVRLQLAYYSTKMNEEVYAHTTRREPEIAIEGAKDKIDKLIAKFEAKIV